MKVFLKRTHISGIVGAILVAAYVWTLTRWYIPQIQTTSEVMNFIIRWALTITSLLGSYKYLNTFGLYIEDDNIYFKTLFRKKKINPEEIVAIKIARAVIKLSRAGEGANLIDRQGNQLYTMVFVNGEMLEEDLKKDNSDNLFLTCYERYIICYCVYDQSIIDYLLTLNPNIIVF